MSVDLAQTSLPRWAYEPRVEAVDLTGRAYTVLVVESPGAAGVADAWVVELHGRPVTRHDCADDERAVAALTADLAGARVGHRVLVAGTARDCLAVRAAAVRAGLADDELVFGVVSADERSVWCVHCEATTSAVVALDEVVVCAGCARRLVVYPHVSRRTGHHLGFMVDAEDQA